MGYDVHITRRENWFDEDDKNQIPLADWISYINADPEMRLDNFIETPLPNGKKLRFDNKGLCVWLKYSGNGLRGNFAWFAFIGGNVVVKNPDSEITNKMIDIAVSLNAKVQGDEGEIYNKKESLKKAVKSWWKFWK